MRLVLILLILGVVFGLVLWVVTSRPDTAAERRAQRRRKARWRVDDTGSDVDGRAVMAIVLVAPGEQEPYSRRVITKYDAGDHAQWTVARAEADAMAEVLNVGLDRP